MEKVRELRKLKYANKFKPRVKIRKTIKPTNKQTHFDECHCFECIDKLTMKQN